MFEQDIYGLNSCKQQFGNLLQMIVAISSDLQADQSCPVCLSQRTQFAVKTFFWNSWTWDSVMCVQVIPNDDLVLHSKYNVNTILKQCYRSGWIACYDENHIWFNSIHSIVLTALWKGSSPDLIVMYSRKLLYVFFHIQAAINLCFINIAWKHS